MSNIFDECDGTRYSQFDDFLRPCPFCGGNAEYDSKHYCGKTDTGQRLLSGHAVYCVDSVGGCIGNPTFSAIYDTREEAFKAWNARASLEKLEQENARYKEALKFYANHIHWMGLAGDSKLQTVLIAGKLWDMNGWAVAENALNPRDLPKPDYKPDYKSEYLGNISPAGADPDVP